MSGAALMARSGRLRPNLIHLVLPFFLALLRLLLLFFTLPEFG